MTGSVAIGSGAGASLPPSVARAQATEKEWSLLFYNAGHADESKMCTASLLDLERVGSDDNTHVVAMNYRSPWLPEQALRINQAHNGARTYYVEKHEHAQAPAWIPTDARALANFLKTKPADIGSPEIDRKDTVNMGDPETLRQFLLDNVQRFPAKHYALFISGHGAAFGGQSIVHHPEGRIHNEKLAEVLADVSQQTGKKFALVNLNTCFGANLETLYPLRNVADAAVGSQGTIFAGTQPFVAVLKDIQDGVKEGLQLSGADVARLCVEESRRQPLGNLFTETLSAVDLTQLQNVADAVKGLQDALATAEQETLREAWKASHRIDYSSIPRQVWVTDVASFADEVGKRISDDAVRAAVKQVREAVDAAVVAETHADSNRETVTSRAMRFGFGKREQDLSRLSGLTFYLDDEAFAKGSRLQLINQSEYGADGRPEAFMKHLSGGRPEPTPLQRALNTIKEKHAVVEQKAVQALRIPQVVPIAERVLLGAGMLGGLRGLSHFGIPAYSVGFGSYFAIRGTLGVINGTRDALHNPDREALVVAGSQAALGAATAAFGLHLLGLLPREVAWPAAIVAGGAQVGREVGRILARTPARRALAAQAQDFRKMSTADKLSSTQKA